MQYPAVNSKYSHACRVELSYFGFVVYVQCVCWSGKIEVVVVIGKCVLNVDRYVCFFFVGVD